LFQKIRGLWYKQSQSFRATIIQLARRAIWSPVNYESLAKEGYGQNVYVFACVRQIAMAASGINWVLYQKGKSLKEIENHPLIDLLQRPNPDQGFSRFLENVIGYLMLSGNSYIESVSPTTGPPRELYVLRPDRMRVIPGNSIQPVAGYEYSVGMSKVPFDAKTVLHLKLFNPLDDWYGMSPLQAAARSVDQNNESKAWNVALLQNFAQPAGVFKTEQNLDDEQYNRLQGEFNSKYPGSPNAGRAMLLEAGMSWESISLSPADMAWIEGQKLSAREIAIAFGVPPEMIGDNTNKTYSNYQEARSAFYEETILPLLDWIRDEWNNWLVPLFGDNLYLDYDRDDIEALQESRDATWARVQKSWWITLNEARSATGYDDDPDFGDMYQWQLNPKAPSAETETKSNFPF